MFPWEFFRPFLGGQKFLGDGNQHWENFHRNWALDKLHLRREVMDFQTEKKKWDTLVCKKKKHSC